MSALLIVLVVVLVTVGIGLVYGEVLHKQRALRRLPPNTSGGVPVAATRRERILVALFCCLVAALLVWLVADVV